MLHYEGLHGVGKLLIREELVLIRPVYHRILFAIVLLSFTVVPRVNAQEPKPVAPQIELTPTANGVKIARANESFSTLSLKGSDLLAEAPLFGSREVTPQFVRELLQVKWRPNDPLDLYVILPVGVKNPPVVLYLYSYPSDTDRFKDNRFCERVTQSGTAAVGFVSALTGHRYGHRPMREWFISELPESLVTTVHDVQMILNYLETRGDLDTTRVGMFGQGSGGSIAVLAASTDSRLKALDLLNPWADWPDWLAKSPLVAKEAQASFLKPEFLTAVEPLDPLRFLPALNSASVRVQIVDGEVDATKESTEKILASAPATAKTAHYPNGRAMYAVSSGGRLFEWLPSVLKLPTETKQVVAKTPPAIPAP